MTFASKNQHRIYWGPLKKPIEWSLKTFLAPWAYMASVMYHDSFWYPVKGRRAMHQALDSVWGRLFRNWETVKATEHGFPDVGTGTSQIKRTGFRAFADSLRILALCLKEAPEFGRKRRKIVTPKAAPTPP
jgi:hypothetical protein